MEFNSKTVKKILLIILFSAATFAAAFNFDNFWNFVLKIFSIFAPIITALCIAFVLNVLLVLLETKVFRFMDKAKHKWQKKLKRPICIVLTYLIALGLLATVILVIIPDIVDTVTMLADKLPAFLGDAKEWLENLLHKFNLEQASLPDIKINWSAAAKTITGWLQNYSGKLFGDAVNLTASVFSGVFDTILSIVISVYILCDKEKIGAFAKRVVDNVFNKKINSGIYNVCGKAYLYFSRFIAGQFAEAVILGVLCFIGMSIFRFPHALIISVIISVTALIPVVGSIVGAVLGFLLIVITNPIKALLFLVFLIILQQLETNLIYPKVVGKVVGLPGVIVVSAVLIGGNIGGILGTLVAVPTSAVLFTLLKEYLIKKEQSVSVITD